MHMLLFLFYSLVLGWLVTRMRFFRDSGMRPLFLLAFFGLHVFAGCLQNWIAWHFFPGHGDVWSLYKLSFVTRHELLTDFQLFLANNSRWIDLPHNVLTIILMILNWVSFDNLYIDTLLFSFPMFLGSIALFRVFRQLFPADPLTALSAILLPSTLFWTSCIYTEGILYALTGWLLYCLYKASFVPYPRTPIPYLRSLAPCSRSLVCCIPLFFAAFFRLSTLITLLPALAVWGLSIKTPFRRRLLTMTGVLIVLVLLSVFFFPAWFEEVSRYLIVKQQEFQHLDGGSRLYLPVLEASWGSFLHVLPWALLNGLFEPLPGSGGKAMYLAFSGELIFVWGIVCGGVLTALKRRLSRSPTGQPGSGGTSGPGGCPSPFSLFCLFYALSGMLVVGLIVPFAGAIVRYRSIYLPFLLAPFLHALRLSVPVKEINIKLNKYIFVPPVKTLRG